MKIRNLPLCLLTLAFLGLDCHKHQDNPPTELPPITQEGRNTCGCKIDGQVWVPYYSCKGLSADPCGEISSDIHRIPGQSSFFIQIGAAIKYNDNSLSFFNINTPVTAGILTVGEKIDSVSIQFTKPGSTDYNEFPGLDSKNHLIITKLDTVNNIISGTFQATLYHSVRDSVNITEGRFDLTFAACKCSN